MGILLGGVSHWVCHIKWVATPSALAFVRSRVIRGKDSVLTHLQYATVVSRTKPTGKYRGQLNSNKSGLI